jgi:PKD domain
MRTHRAPSVHVRWFLTLAVSATVLGTLAVVPPSGGGLPAAAHPVPGPLRSVRDLAGPPGTVGSLQVTLYNPSRNATGTYDQPVGINSSHYATLINSNWSNAVIEYTANSTPVNAWIESGNSNTTSETLLWLRLATLAPLAWTNVSIYFGPKDWFNLSEDGYLGENPGLSPTYAEFDNGWRVFDAYANFSGTALPSGWTPLGSWAGTVHDGLTVAANYEVGAVEVPLPRAATSNLTVDTSATRSAPGDPLDVFLAGTPGFSSQNQFFPDAYAFEAGLSADAAAAIETGNATGAGTFEGPSVLSPVDFSTSPHVLGISWDHGNSTEKASVSYYPILSQVNATISALTDFGLGTYCNGNCSTWNVTWVRARSAPNPLPVVSDEAFAPFGVVASGSPLVTDTNHAVGFYCNATLPSGSGAYSWTFGDGQSTIDRNPLHAFAKPGTFVAVCSVAGPGGSEGSSSTAVKVNPPPSILLFQAVPSNFPLGSTLNLVASIGGGTGPYNYSYVGLPPGCPGKDTASLSCLPGETGTFAIEVVVRDGVSEETSAWITVTITPASTPSGGSSLSPTEGYVLAGGVAGLVVLAGVLPVLIWDRRRPPRPARSTGTPADVEEDPPVEPGDPVGRE